MKLHLQNLSASTDRDALILETLNMILEHPGAIGVYGPNGSGKSTILRRLAGLNSSLNWQGEVILDGKLISPEMNPRERVQEILYLGSDFRSPFDLNVRDLFEMGALAKKQGAFVEVGHEERNKIAEVIERLKLASFLTRIFSSLSDGEKQLMMFARGLIHAPRLLILDETTSKLDLDKLVLVAKVIREWTTRGMKFFIASHDLNFLSEASDELMLLKQGKVLGMGPVENLLNVNHLEDLYPNLSLQVVRSPETGRLKVLY